MIQPVLKGKEVSGMVWAAFWGEERSDLYKLARDFESKKLGYSANSYLEILDNNLLGIWQSGLIFIQDNAPIHKAKKVMKWFEDNGVILTDWPPYSPDLNLIEHLWYELKKLIYQVRPDIDSVTGSDNTVREALWKALEEAWTLIDNEIMKKLIGGCLVSVMTNPRHSLSFSSSFIITSAIRDSSLSSKQGYVAREYVYLYIQYAK